MSMAAPARAGAAMDTEAPLGARAGAATRVEAAARMAATTAETEKAKEAMEVADTVVGVEAPVGQPGQGGAQPLLQWSAPLECVRTNKQQLLRGQRSDPRRH